LPLQNVKRLEAKSISYLILRQQQIADTNVAMYDRVQVDEDEDEFTLPASVEALKDEVLSGRSWSMNLEVPPSPDMKETAEDYAQHSVTARPFSMISSSTPMRRPSLRTPSTHRDLGYLLGFVLHWAVFVVALLISGTASFGSSDVVAWAGRLRLAVVLGAVIGALCLALIVLDKHRGVLARAAHPTAAASQMVLAAMVAFGGSVSLWILASVLGASALVSLLQVRRVCDQLNFLLVLLEVAVEVLSQYPLVIAVGVAGCLLQLAFLTWWVGVFAVALSSSGWLMILLVLLNGYWTSQTLRLLAALVTVGIISHWFANARSSESTEEETNDSTVPISNPLLFDGALLPPIVGGSQEEHALGQQADTSFEGSRRGVERFSSRLDKSATPDTAAVVLHLARSGATTSLGTVCRASLSCLTVRLAESSLRVCNLWPSLERLLCADWCEQWVRSHHELLLVHVASYAKSHSAAARDVWQLINESGLEVVQEDDVTGPVLRAICLAAAASAALLVSAGTHYGSAASTQWALFMVSTMAVTFAAIAQALQVIDSAVAAIYVCFAEHPESLRAHFPLVHHRFARIAEFSTYFVGDS